MGKIVNRRGILSIGGVSRGGQSGTEVDER